MSVLRHFPISVRRKFSRRKSYESIYLYGCFPAKIVEVLAAGPKIFFRTKTQSSFQFRIWTNIIIQINQKPDWKWSEIHRSLCDMYIFVVRPPVLSCDQESFRLCIRLTTRRWEPPCYSDKINALFISVRSKIFMGGGAGVVGGSGNSERCLKWGGGVGIIKESFRKHLKIGGWQRQKLFVGGGGLEGVAIPAPSWKF